MTPQALAPILSLYKEAKRVSRVGASSRVLWPLPLPNLVSQP